MVAQVDSRTQRCPDNGASVDLSDLRVFAGQGQRADPGRVGRSGVRSEAERVLLRARAGESDLSLVDMGCDPRTRGTEPEAAPTIQERAYTSPIWFLPANGR